MLELLILLFGVVLALLIAAVVRSSGARGYAANKAEAQADGGIASGIEDAARSFYAFLKELDSNPRCRDELRALPGMGNLPKSGFTIDARLASIALCDARDCYCMLGNPLSGFSTTAGMGFLMLAIPLFNTDFDISHLRDPKFRKKLEDPVAGFVKSLHVDVSGDGFDCKFRFGVIFGLMNNESEWVQRYSTLMYRWASLMAKTDGIVTSRESGVLAQIMKMRECKNSGNVRVSASGDGVPAAPWKPGGGHLANGAAAPSGNESADRGRGLKDALASLDSLVGLAPVKEEVRKLVSFIQIQRKRKESGLKTAPISYHCVFTGNPGTGKTTVARIIADVYRELGVVKRGHLVETDRSGLIGEYVGQTAVKTNKTVDSALDGVLFIDEAYSLVQGGQNDYGREAVATLLKRMEDDRDRLVVVLAGYTDEMRAFIESNPGLRSRFNRYIDFPDYSAEELSEIFLSLAAKSEYRCDDSLRASLADAMRRAAAGGDRAFGNARFVRNLFESAIERQAVRLSSVPSVTTAMLQELTLQDLQFDT